MPSDWVIPKIPIFGVLVPPGETSVSFDIDGNEPYRWLWDRPL